jgi:chromosomal replication initiation ATPase DnaA
MSKRYFPFHTLGFRCNPFRALTRQEWSEVAVIPPQIEEIISRDFMHLQVIGEQGVGKTSTLLALKRHFSNLGQRVQYHYLPPGKNRFRGNIRTSDILLLDEMQRLSKTHRTRLIKEFASQNGKGLHLICSTHEDLTLLFERHNLPLETKSLDRHEKAFVRQVVERRLQFFALDKRPQVRFTESAFRFLDETFASDLRSLEDLLYDVFQQQSFEREIDDETLRQAMRHNPSTPERG